MRNRHLLLQHDLEERELDDELSQAFDCPDTGTSLEDWLQQEQQTFKAGHILTGRVVNIVADSVLVDVGYKSEGLIPLDEWLTEVGDQVKPPRIGEQIQVLLDTLEDDSGGIVLSYRKASRCILFDRFLADRREGDVVEGVVTRKIKGGLLVAIAGVTAFLPESQINLRRPGDIAAYLNQNITCEIISIDAVRRNIVVSRRTYLERQRAEAKAKLLAEIAPGQVRKGIVRNIVGFGAFVDLGGLDGLLHLSDMAWHRVSDPHEVVRIDQQLDVYIISVDREKEKIALGLKQKYPSPWTNVSARYPVGSRQVGEVVSITSYGAFVRLEPGIEGLVHISAMSWTRRLNHPSERVSLGDRIEVQVLRIDKDKQEISLGMKQVQSDPWDRVAEKYKPNAVITGVVRNLTNYGAFIEIEEGIDGLLHVSDMSWVQPVNRPQDIVRPGDRVTCIILTIDPERKRIALGLKQLKSDPWENDIPARYRVGETKKGKVAKRTSFGLFVELEPGLEGLLHASQLADHEDESPQDFKVGDEIEVKVLRVDAVKRKIGLSRTEASS